VRLGYLVGEAREDPAAQNLRRQFVLGMRDLGYIEGRNYVMEERYAAGQMDLLASYAQGLVDLPVDVIVAGGEAAIRAAKRATSQIPIVMTLAADPVGSGLVPTLAHPAGNVTGMSALASDLASKRVELLKELVPQAKRVAVLWNPGQSVESHRVEGHPACRAIRRSDLAAIRCSDLRRDRPGIAIDQARTAGCDDCAH
jgi:putative ABC transport system substrate-binding protein